MPTFADLDVLVIRDDLVVEEIDGECLVLDLDRNVYFGLNDLGRLVWQSLDGSSSVSDVLSTLVEHFPGVGRERLGADLDAFLSSLVDASLARVTGR